MKAVVDQEVCIGCGLCPSICEEVFEIGDEGTAISKVDEVSAEVLDTAKDAESSCPVGAITIE